MLDRNKVGSQGSSVENLNIALPEEEPTNFNYGEVRSEEIEEYQEDFTGRRPDSSNVSASNNSFNDPTR